MTDNNIRRSGHIAASFTVLMWGTTFVFTKSLLVSFTPIEILFIRFLLGYLALWLVRPRQLKTAGKQEELLFAAAGLCGVTLYYLCENVALTFTLASNVGVIVSTAPLFTALLAFRFLGEERPGLRFFLGFGAAIGGVALVSWGGGGVSLDLRGDLLSLFAAFVWGIYSILTRKFGALGYDNILCTRRVFFYGILFMIPTLFFMDFHPQVSALLQGANLFGILYLGLGAGAACFVTWNLAVKRLGALTTSVYIYLVPLVTIVASAMVLHERMTLVSLLGMALILAGLFLSQDWSGRGKENHEKTAAVSCGEEENRVN